MIPDKLQFSRIGHVLPEAMAFQPLTSDFVGSAFRLSAQADWNQTEEDWDRLRRLESAHVGVWVDHGDVRASYSLTAYGDQVAWIGMILVDQDYRGAGLGKATFQSALKHARSLGLKVLGLDATELGEPIYLKAGFQTVCPIVRWQGDLMDCDLQQNGRDVHKGLNPAILEWDTLHVGVDRSALLADFEAADGTVLRCEKAGHPSALAVIRPGRTAMHLGPVVAESEADLLTLLSAVAPLVRGQRVICDVLSPEIEGALKKFGLHPSRHLKRMTSPLSKECLCGPAVRCAAGFEFG